MKLLEKIINAVLYKIVLKCIICFSVIILICINGATNFVLHANSYITYNYSLAAQGKHPNGTRLNVYDIISEPVLTDVLEKTGLTKELTWQELGKMISVNAINTKIPEDEYIATEYKININIANEISGVYAKDLLNQIMKSYSKYFYNNYVGNQSVFNYTPYEFNKDEYLTVQANASLKAKLLFEYVADRAKTSKDYVSSKTGETFSSLKQRLNDFLEISLEKYSSYINNYGLTKNYDKFIAENNYGIMKKDLQYDRYLLQYDIRLQAIKDYELTQSAVVMIPTKDTDGEFYMSKTKTGVDYISADAIQNMSEAKNQLFLINKSEKLVNNSKKTFTSIELQKIISTADEMVIDIRKSMDELEQLVYETDNDYIKNNNNNLLMIKNISGSTMEEYNIKDAIFISGALFVLLCVLSWYFIKLKEKLANQEKKYAKV